MIFGTLLIISWIKSNIHLRDDIVKEINGKFTPSDDVVPLIMPPKFLDSLWISIKESCNDCYKEKSLYGIQAKVLYSIKPLIYILQSSKDDETRLKLPQSYPISQQSPFGEDFDHSSEKSSNYQ